VRFPLRRRERAVAAAIVVQLLAAVPTALTLGPSGGSAAHGRLAHADAVRDSARASAIRALLARRSDAVRTHDRQEWLADIDPNQTAFLAKQATVFDRLQAVQFASWGYAVDPTNEQPPSDELSAKRGSWWAPDVALRYEIAGYDSVPTEEDQGFTFVQRDGRWYLAADDDFPDRRTQRDLWDTGEVRVTRGVRCLVLAHPQGAGMAALALRECDAAVPRVTAVWGTGWAQKVVLLVPDTSAELQQLVADIGDVSNVAAVATAELVDPSTGYHPVGDRVLVNPKSFRDLGPVGRRVVLTHEVTHVSTRGATGPYEPTWMVEGIADYVGFLHSGVPLSLSALELRKAMRAGHLPTRLPPDSAYQGGRADLAATYEQSWLAVSLLVKRYGLATVLRLYRDIGAGESKSALDLAFAKDLHTTVAAFTATWAASLRQQLL
jgi:hypothetical protein